MIVGEQYKDGVVARCWECGDSKNQRHGHFVLFNDGTAHCFRCGYTTKLPLDMLLQVALENVSMEEAIEAHFNEEELPLRQPTAGGRNTYLQKYNVEGRPDYVTFLMRDSNGNTIGYHNRHKTQKIFDNEGNRGIGYCTEQLVSTPDRPLVVVEGPYDVIEPHYACVFGSVSVGTLKYFRLQHLWLFPDPDILDTADKRHKFKMLGEKAVEQYGINLLGIVWSDRDPDEFGAKRYFLRHGPLQYEEQTVNF